MMQRKGNVVRRKRLIQRSDFYTVWIGERDWANPELTTRFPGRQGALNMARRNADIGSKVWNRYGNLIYSRERQ